jgi:hypothetical protein
MRATAFRSRARTVAAPSRDGSGIRNGANGATVRSPGTTGSIIRPWRPPVRGSRAMGKFPERRAVAPVERPCRRPGRALRHSAGGFLHCPLGDILLMRSGRRGGPGGFRNFPISARTNHRELCRSAWRIACGHLAGPENAF